MPDQFIPYPSPAMSWGSPTSTQAVDPIRLGAGDQPGWLVDPFFNALYQDTPEQASLTAEQMATIYELENVLDSYSFPLNPNSPAPDGQAGQMSLFPTSEDVVPQFSFGSNIIHPSAPAPQLFTPHDSPTYTAQSQPQQHPGSLSPLALGTSAHPPSPPYTYNHSQLFQPYPIPQRQPPPSHAATKQIQRRPHEPERMSLPGVGDLNVSMCEVIM